MRWPGHRTSHVGIPRGTIPHWAQRGRHGQPRAAPVLRDANSSWVPHPARPGLSRSLPPLRVFFDSCDGFFTNYNWREDHLQRMVARAGKRLADVYVGVDVFARSNVVGGRFDTDKVGGRLLVYMPSLASALAVFQSH